MSPHGNVSIRYSCEADEDDDKNVPSNNRLILSFNNFVDIVACEEITPEALDDIETQIKEIVQQVKTDLNMS